MNVDKKKILDIMNIEHKEEIMEKIEKDKIDDLKFADLCIFNIDGTNKIEKRFLIIQKSYNHLKKCFYPIGEKEEDSFVYHEGLSNIAYLMKKSKLFEVIKDMNVGETKRYKDTDVFISLDKLSRF